LGSKIYLIQLKKPLV